MSKLVSSNIFIYNEHDTTISKPLNKDNHVWNAGLYGFVQVCGIAHTPRMWPCMSWTVGAAVKYGCPKCPIHCAHTLLFSVTLYGQFVLQLRAHLIDVLFLGSFPDPFQRVKRNKNKQKEKQAKN